MKPFDADVIIVGAGPAGSLAAYDLAMAGIRVLVLEKSPFPRYKVCGAGLTHKILSEIPFPLDPVIETTIRSVRFSCHFRELFTRTSIMPMIYCTMRDRLDEHLLGKAERAGAGILFGQHVKGLKQEGNGVIIETRTSSFKSRLVIGADGASGNVARSAGFSRRIEKGLAWEAELRTDPSVVRSLSETVFLDWGTLPGGYAWMFPKRDHLSVGVGGPARLSPFMIPYYRSFIKTFQAEGPVQQPVTMSLRSWPIPVGLDYGRYHSGQIMIAGDAAGLTDPMTGEGIWYAVRSGRLAAQASIRFLGGELQALPEYTAAVNESLVKEIREANRIRSVFNAVPWKIHRLVRDKDRVWRAFGKILRGERQYADVRKGFGPYRFLWGITIFLCSIVSSLKEKKVVRANPAAWIISLFPAHLKPHLP